MPVCYRRYAAARVSATPHRLWFPEVILTTESLDGNEAMHGSEQLVALVALLKGGPYQGAQMKLRQQLVEGRLPTEIVEDEALRPQEVGDAQSLVDGWCQAGETPLSWLDVDYPRQLRDVHDFPPVIFVRGNLVREDMGICVVGSRDAGEHAERAAREIASGLVGEGLTVVSGLAEGVDTAAHEAALQQGGRTVAVIGSGIDRYYPARNRPLQQALESEGMVLSQFWPGSSPARFTFPMRNAVMSAYAQATIIVAASEKSGTRHQARQAVAHGRPLVLSRSVASYTTWGRALVEDPAALVEVADGPESAVELAISMFNGLVPELT